MTDAELIIRSSIQVLTTMPGDVMPSGFGSGCLLEHNGRTFFVSVSHVTDYDELSVSLETNQPADERGQILEPVGPFYYYSQIKVTPEMSLEDFQSILDEGQRLDITFALVKNEMDLRHLETDFGSFKVEAGSKVKLYSEDAAVPDRDQRYGFYGKVRHEYQGRVLKMEPTFKHSLKYHRTKDHFHIFLAPDVITDKSDYQGCSGAPILDSDGRIVALACAVYTGSKIIYGFSIQECLRLIDYSVQIDNL